MFKYEEISLGCDPEVLLYHADQGYFVSSCGKFGGTKQEPLKLTPEVSIQEDNVALEFNIVPCYTKKEWGMRLKKAIETVATLVNAKGLRISHQSSAEYVDEELDTPESRIFGCEPDYNAWTGEENPPISQELQEGNFRTAGGHVHVGYKNPTPEATIELMRTMDVFLGVPSTVIDFEGGLRRTLYGKPGAFRYKPYGGEYRTLSNFWVLNQRQGGFIYDQTLKAINFLNKGNMIDISDAPRIQSAILTNNKEAIASLCLKYNVLS